MAIAFVGARGTNAAKGTITSGSVTTTAAVSSGNTLVLLVAGNRTSGGVPSLTVSGGSLTWSIEANIYGDSDSYSVIVTALAPSGVSSGTVITLTWASSIDAYAASLVEFSGLGTHTTPANNVATGTNTTPSAAVSASTDELVVGVVGVVGPSGDSFTQDADTTNGSWSTITADGTTGNPASGNATVRGAYKIVTGTGTQTYNPTLGNSRPWSETVVSLAAEVISGSATQDTITGSTQAGKKGASGSGSASSVTGSTQTGKKGASAPKLTVDTAPVVAVAGRKAAAATVSGSTAAGTASTGTKNARSAPQVTTVGGTTAEGSGTATGTAVVDAHPGETATGTKATSGAASQASTLTPTVAGSRSASGSATASASLAVTASGAEGASGAASVTTVVGVQAAGEGSPEFAGSASTNAVVATAGDGFATVPITGDASIVAPPAVVSSTGTVSGVNLGRHALAVQMMRRRIRGAAAVAPAPVAVTATGEMNDDELVLELLEIA